MKNKTIFVKFSSSCSHGKNPIWWLDLEVWQQGWGQKAGGVRKALASAWVGEDRQVRGALAAPLTEVPTGTGHLRRLCRWRTLADESELALESCPWHAVHVEPSEVSVGRGRAAEGSAGAGCPAVDIQRDPQARASGL